MMRFSYSNRLWQQPLNAIANRTREVLIDYGLIYPPAPGTVASKFLDDFSINLGSHLRLGQSRGQISVNPLPRSMMESLANLSPEERESISKLVTMAPKANNHDEKFRLLQVETQLFAHHFMCLAALQRVLETWHKALHDEAQKAIKQKGLQHLSDRLLVTTNEAMSPEKATELLETVLLIGFSCTETDLQNTAIDLVRNGHDVWTSIEAAYAVHQLSCPGKPSFLTLNLSKSLNQLKVKRVQKGPQRPKKKRPKRKK
jgi:hypothetical protein